VLEHEGYGVELACDGEEALASIADTPPDAVILDLMLPGTGGVEVCRRLRAQGNRVPLLMLTARDAVGDRVLGLEAGADDYLAKPFSVDELRARVHALLRRAGCLDSAPLVYGEIMLDTRTYEARRGERPLGLTRTEFNLLEVLLRHPGQVLTKTALYEQVWGYDLELSSRSLDVYVGYLRRKLEAGGEPRVVHSVRGVGYVLRERQ
jgi:two-component system response regulator MprA